MTNSVLEYENAIYLLKEPDGMYLGYLNDFPEHWTQGTDLEDLKEHLQDLYEEFSKEDLPGGKHVAELELA